MIEREDKISFVFPESVLNLESVSSIQDLRERLTLQEIYREEKSWKVKYRFSIQKGRYLYARCSAQGCKASLNFKLAETNDAVFQLYRSTRTHHHRLARSRNIRFQQALEYIKSMPAGVPLTALRSATCRQFFLNNKQFYYLIRKQKANSLTFESLVTQLQTNGYQVYISSQDRSPSDPPQVAVFVSPLMKSYFSQYGQKISFDLTFNLIKTKSSRGNLWKIGAMLGTSRTGRLVPLGLAVTQEMTKDAYMEIFRMLFRAHGGQPRVVISDEEKAVRAALRQLGHLGEFEGVHLHDEYHVLHNIYKQLEIKEHISYFRKLIKARNKGQFIHWQVAAEKHLTRI